MSYLEEFYKSLNEKYPPFYFDYRSKTFLHKGPNDSVVTPDKFLWFGLANNPNLLQVLQSGIFGRGSKADSIVTPEGWKWLLHCLVYLAKIFCVAVHVVISIVPNLIVEAIKNLTVSGMEAWQGNTCDPWYIGIIKFVGLCVAGIIHVCFLFLSQVILDSIFSPIASIWAINRSIKRETPILKAFGLTLLMFLKGCVSLAAAVAIAYFLPPLLPFIFPELLPTIFWNAAIGVASLLLTWIGWQLNKSDQHNIYAAIQMAQVKEVGPSYDATLPIISFQTGDSVTASNACGNQSVLVAAAGTNPSSEISSAGLFRAKSQTDDDLDPQPVYSPRADSL